MLSLWRHYHNIIYMLLKWFGKTPFWRLYEGNVDNGYICFCSNLNVFYITFSYRIQGMPGKWTFAWWFAPLWLLLANRYTKDKFILTRCKKRTYIYLPAGGRQIKNNHCDIYIALHKLANNTRGDVSAAQTYDWVHSMWSVIVYFGNPRWQQKCATTKSIFFIVNVDIILTCSSVHLGWCIQNVWF